MKCGLATTEARAQLLMAPEAAASEGGQGNWVQSLHQLQAGLDQAQCHAATAATAVRQANML